MKVSLLYGDGTLEVEVPSENVAVVVAPEVQVLADEAAACREAFDKPIGTPSLNEVLSGARRVAVVIPDGTRPLPFQRLLNWLLPRIDAAGSEAVIVVGTGSHRANTAEELTAMLGEEIVARRRVVNHSAFDRETLVEVGVAKDGQRVLMNRHVVDADRRIAIGFIEPHFVAGFSGGYKAIMPGVTDIETILHYHRAEVIGDPRSTWGVLAGNPTQRIVREYGALCPIHFLFNITMTPERRITGFFCGDPIAAHEAGCGHIKEEAMVPVSQEFPIVMTCNNGFPLDQNLYQAVKGMSAAAMIVAQDGLILQASECRDGFPDHGNFKKLLFDHADAASLLRTVNTPGFSLYDQWEAQLLAMVRRRARIGILSKLPDDDARRAFLEPVADLREAVAGELKNIGKNAPIAVLPTGFATVPYLRQA
jgi:nickel-dependent lactate racemase